MEINHLDLLDPLCSHNYEWNGQELTKMGWLNQDSSMIKSRNDFNKISNHDYTQDVETSFLPQTIHFNENSHNTE